MKTKLIYEELDFVNKINKTLNDGVQTCCLLTDNFVHEVQKCSSIWRNQHIWAPFTNLDLL